MTNRRRGPFRQRLPVVALLAIAVAFITPVVGAQPTSPTAASADLVVIAPAMPEIPAISPARFLVLPLENRSNVRALDWLIAGGAAAVAEKIEPAFQLDPAFGPLIVDGLRPATSKELVVEQAQHTGARYVFGGWVTRTNWELELGLSLWLVDSGAATLVGESHRLGPFADFHKFVGAELTELATAAGWNISDRATTILSAQPSRDMYAYTLLGRGLGRLTSVLGAGGPNPVPVPLLPADLAAASRDLQRAVFIDPNFALGQRMVGEFLQRHPSEPRDQQRAVGKFNNALDVSPNYIPALRASAVAAAAAGKREQSRELFTKLVLARPWDLAAREGLGEALWATGDTVGAKRELGRLLVVDPGLLPARRVLALIHAETGDTVALVEELEAIATLTPDDLAVQADLSAAYNALGRYPAAIAILKKLAEKRPGDTNLLMQLGDAARWSGEVATAKSAYNEAIAAAPDDPRGYFAAADLAESQGLLDEARIMYGRTIRFPDLVPYAYHALGIVLLEQKSLDEAIWYLRRAVKLRPRAVAPRVAVIVAELVRDDKEAAKAQLAAALPAWPGQPELQYLAAIVALRDGDRVAARASLLRAGNLPAARQAISLLDAGGAPELVLVLPRDPPVGDARRLEASLVLFAVARNSLAAIRERFASAALEILGVMGEGPGKPAKLSKRNRVCPLARVVRPWRIARDARADFLRAGLALEGIAEFIERADSLGQTSSMLPHQRAAMVSAVKEQKLAREDLRDMGAMWTVALGRELTYVRCSTALLEAAAADPKNYPPAPSALPPVAVERQPALPPRRATFYVDNQDCPDPVDVFVDGLRLAETPGGQRRAVTAPVGRRSLCLLAPGRAICGDRGTVREVYLHEGWEVVMTCPRTP